MKRIYGWPWLTILPALGLLPFLGQFAYSAYAEYTDLAISHYPNMLYLQRALTQFGQVPFWSPTILSGYPFAANSLSGLWYPPGWLALLFPLPLGMNLVTLLHVAFAGFGMYLFLRAEGLSQPAAAVGGLALTALPRLASHFASGHLTLVYAVCWTPWLLWSARRSVSKRCAVGQGLKLGAVILADPRWAVYAGLLWAAYRLRAGLNEDRHGVGALWRVMRVTFPQMGLALLLAAPLLLPLAEYTGLSTRGDMLPADSLLLSLPLARLAGFFIPSMDGNTEWFVYPGALLTIALLWYGFQPRLWCGKGFWLLVAVAGILLALGENFPGGALVAQAPGFRLLRVPPRSLLLTGFALAVLVGHLLQDLTQAEMLKLRSAYFSRLAVVGAAGLTLLAAGGVTLLSGEPPLNFWWGASFLTICMVLVLLRDRGMINASVWVGGCILILLVDMLGVSSLSMYFRPAQRVLAEGAEAAQWINQQTGKFRVYTPDYSIPQQTAAYYGLELVNGVDPLQIKVYAAAIEETSGIPQEKYDVVLPPLSDDGSVGSPDASRLAMLNTRYIVAKNSLSADGLQLAAIFGSVRIYQNLYTRPRAWVERSGQDRLAVSHLALSPNSITMQAIGPGTLILSEIAYPGWQVWIDGQQERLIDGQLLRRVAIPAGEHAVAFYYRPTMVFLGLGLCGLGILICFICLLQYRKGKDANI